MKKHYGKCALCGKECELTFEHIPPKSAFNDYPAKVVSGGAILENKDKMPWELKGLPYTNQQKGSGKYSICKECNNNTGSWYGDAYCQFAYSIFAAISRPIPSEANAVVIKDIYPLKVIKQVLSMFCSINPRAKDYDPLRKFVIEKETVGLDKSQYKVFMYFTKSKLVKLGSLSVAIIKSENNSFVNVPFCEITVPPLGFVLFLTPPKKINFPGIDITGFSDCQYDEICDITFRLCILEMNDIYPLHYRSKEDIRESFKEVELQNKEKIYSNHENGVKDEKRE